jgi:ribonuclease D
MKIHFHEGDLPGGVDFGKSVAIDTETLGLNPLRDALCLAQLSGGDGHCHVVRFDRATYHAPNMVRLLSDPDVVKIFHYARFDVAVFQRYLKISTTPIWCTKIASKLVRTYTDRHGLKDLVKELLDVDLSKQQQSSDWGAAKLSDAQLSYAASDVLHLHKLKSTLDNMLLREGRQALALKCFDFVGTRAALDLGGWSQEDIFAH